MLIELTPAAHGQDGLFEDPVALARRTRLNEVMDQINHAYGRESLRLAGSGRTRSWAMKREQLSLR